MKPITQIAIAIILVGTAFLLLKRAKQPETVSFIEAATPVPTPVILGGLPSPTPTPQISPTPQGQTPIKSELQSLSEMTKLISEFSNRKKAFKELVGYLKSSQQEPFLAQDKNSETGEMTIVRTKSPLPGTRYFHAQYFSDETGEKILQHMSFEFKPGPTAMQDAIAAIRAAFPSVGKPTMQKPDFIQWELPNGYVIWAKKMGLKDLKDNPFNAYTPADVGTIWITVEANVNE